MKQSRILDEIHESMSRIHNLGIVNKQTMKEFDKLCFKNIKMLNQNDIKHIREKEHVSQSILAKYLNMSVSTIAKWERGIKKPSGPALKLLNIIYEKGLVAIL